MMKKILAPVDFSDASINGLYYAYELAHFLDIELVLLHTIYIKNEISYFEYFEIEEAAKEKLEEICRHLSKTTNNKNINYHFLVKQGNLCTNIQNIIEEKGIDMIIMGTKGIEDSTLPYGSASAEVIAKITCPLIIVPQKIDFSLIKNIVYATDLKDEESLLIKFVNALAKNFQAHINYVNICDLSFIGEELNQLNLSKRKQSTSFHQVEGSNTLEGINSFAEIQKADLIVMTTSQRKQLDNLLTSHTRQMVFKTKIPLLVMYKADSVY